MANYKNQKRINIGELKTPLLHIKKEKEDEKEQFLLSLNWKELLNVMSDLEPAEYILWQYLLKWRGKTFYDFSPADLEINFGWSENSSRKYRNALEKKGYIIKNSQNQYEFIPYPEVVELRAAAIREKNRVKHESHK